MNAKTTETKGLKLAGQLFAVYSNGKLVASVYNSKEQGIDTGTKYATVCEVHGIIAAESRISTAKRDAMNTQEFCEECASIH